MPFGLRSIGLWIPPLHLETFLRVTFANMFPERFSPEVQTGLYGDLIGTSRAPRLSFLPSSVIDGPI